MAIQYPTGGGQRPRRPQYIPQGPKAMRKNDRIRAPEVRVIGADGKQIGVISTREAIRQAQVLGLDLIEVSPGSMPPVCRIADYGKFMYDLGKKQKDHKAHTSKLKEVKFRPRIEQHDYITKLRHAEEFLFEGNKVKMTLFFKGRELEHKDLGFETVKRALADLAHVGVADQPPRLFGRNISLTLSPLPPNKRKLIYNLRGVDEQDAPDDEDVDEDGHTHSSAPRPKMPMAPLAALAVPKTPRPAGTANPLAGIHDTARATPAAPPPLPGASPSG